MAVRATTVGGAVHCAERVAGGEGHRTTARALTISRSHSLQLLDVDADAWAAAIDTLALAERAAEKLTALQAALAKRCAPSDLPSHACDRCAH